MLFLEFFLFLAYPWFRRLSDVLLSGNFNMFLLRPVNTFVHYMFSMAEIGTIIVAFVYLLLLLLYLIFLIPTFNLLLLVITFFFSFLGCIFYASFNCFADSLAFFIKQNNFIRSTHFKINNAFAQYPAVFFENTPIKTFGMFIATSYFSAYATNFYFGYISFEELKILFLILICMIFVLFSLSFLLWKSGLEKYEAFG